MAARAAGAATAADAARSRTPGDREPTAWRHPGRRSSRRGDVAPRRANGSSSVNAAAPNRVSIASPPSGRRRRPWTAHQKPQGNAASLRRIAGVSAQRGQIRGSPRAIIQSAPARRPRETSWPLISSGLRPVRSASKAPSPAPRPFSRTKGSAPARPQWASSAPTGEPADGREPGQPRAEAFVGLGPRRDRQQARQRELGQTGSPISAKAPRSQKTPIGLSSG